MTDARPKHKPNEKHTLDEVLKSLKDLVRNDVLDQPAAVRLAEPAAAAVPPNVDMRSIIDSLEGILDDDLTLEDKPKPTAAPAAARAKKTAATRASEELTISDDMSESDLAKILEAIDFGITPTPAPRANTKAEPEPEQELQIIDDATDVESIVLEEPTLEADTIELSVVEFPAETPEHTQDDVADETTIEIAAAPPPPEPPTEPLAEDTATIDFDSEPTEEIVIEAAPPPQDPDDLAPPPSTDDNDDFMMERAEPPTSSGSGVSLGTLGESVEFDLGLGSTSKSDSTETNAPEMEALEISPAKPPAALQVIEWESSKPTAPAPAAKVPAPSTPAPKPAVQLAPKPIAAKPAPAPKSTAPPAPKPIVASAAAVPAKPKPTPAPANMEIPVLKNVAVAPVAPAAPPPPPETFALEPSPAKPARAVPSQDVRQMAVRVIAKLNIEMRKAGKPPLDVKSINRLQQLLKEALDKK